MFVDLDDRYSSSDCSNSPVHVKKDCPVKSYANLLMDDDDEENDHHQLSFPMSTEVIDV